MIVVNTHRYGPFTFQTGFEQSVIEPHQQIVEVANRMLTGMPAYSEVARQLEKDILVTGVRSTDAIEGGDISDEEATNLLENPDSARENRELRIANLGRAYEQLDSYIKRYADQAILPFNEQYYRQLHNTVTKDLTDGDYNPGQYRRNLKGSNTYVGDEGHGGRYKPPQAYDDICNLMKKLAEWSSSEELAAVHPLVRALLLHYYFERIHPFSDGNGRIGRMVEKAVLMHAGYTGWARALDFYYLQNIDNYYENFNICRKQEKTNPKHCNEPFILFGLKGMAETVERLHGRVSQLAEHMVRLALLGNLLRQKKINERQYQILEFLMHRSSREWTLEVIRTEPWYRALYRNLSPATRSRDWSGLTESGLVKRVGNTITFK